ncbi:MAG: START domain-containing protein [Cyclobacteriaceae bacterium]|nr:START domain-containing protein [Cyclobacteriaceae bacterium]
MKVCFFLYVPLGSNVLWAQTLNDCELKKTDQGISVYFCDRDSSDLKALGAVFEVEATLEQYAATVLNVEEYPSWNFEAKNPRILKQISDTELIYYAEADAPWPVTDRYLVLHLKVDQDPVTKMLDITLRNVPEMIEEKENFVKVKEYNSLLRVVPLSEERLKIQYFLNIDPGGAVPAWVINLVSSRIPINTFSNLKKRLESPESKKKSLVSISNF